MNKNRNPDFLRVHQSYEQFFFVSILSFLKSIGLTLALTLPFKSRILPLRGLITTFLPSLRYRILSWGARLEKFQFRNRMKMFIQGKERYLVIQAYLGNDDIHRWYGYAFFAQ